MTARFYCPDAVFTPGAVIELPAGARHHAERALRLANGETVELFDGRGRQATGPIVLTKTSAAVTIEAVSEPACESPVAVTLVQAFVAGEKLDWIVEKAVECGVVRIVLVPAARSVTRLAGERLAKRLAHCRAVAVSASGQCGRAVVPVIDAMSLESALGLKAQARYILAPGADRPPKLTQLGSVAFAVGPEGGFDAAEIALARSQGWDCALLGPRVLRTETAGIVAATLAHAAAGDLRFL